MPDALIRACCVQHLDPRAETAPSPKEGSQENKQGLLTPTRRSWCSRQHPLRLLPMRGASQCAST